MGLVWSMHKGGKNWEGKTKLWEQIHELIWRVKEKCKWCWWWGEGALRNDFHWEKRAVGGWKKHFKHDQLWHLQFRMHTKEPTQAKYWFNPRLHAMRVGYQHENEGLRAHETLQNNRVDCYGQSSHTLQDRFGTVWVWSNVPNSRQGSGV